MKLILASQSFLRKKALEILGLSFEVIPSYFDEKSTRHEDPYILAKMLSEAKAKTVGEKETDAIIIAADGFILMEGNFLEKPANLQEAYEMLQHLSGKQFQFITGLSVYNVLTHKILSTVETCEITFRKLSKKEIKDYINRYPVLKCAGSFEADGMLRFAQRICGNYNFRAGMPINKLVEFLKANQVDI